MSGLLHFAIEEKVRGDHVYQRHRAVSPSFHLEIDEMIAPILKET